LMLRRRSVLTDLAERRLLLLPAEGDGRPCRGERRRR
jgi:hypothetical protein